MVCNVLSREKLWYRKNWILFFDLWQLNFFFVACKIKKIKIVQIKKEKGIKKNCNFSSSLFSSLFNKLINLESFEFLLFWSRYLSIKKKSRSNVILSISELPLYWETVSWTSSRDVISHGVSTRRKETIDEPAVRAICHDHGNLSVFGWMVRFNWDTIRIGRPTRPNLCNF